MTFKKFFFAKDIFKKRIPQPQFIPPSSSEGFQQGTLLSVSCPSNYSLTLRVTSSSNQFVQQQISSPFLLRLNESIQIDAFCNEWKENVEFNANLSSINPSNVVSQIYQVFRIAKPVISQSSKTNVGALNLSISCFSYESSPCGILYTLDESISILGDFSDVMKNGVIFSNESIVNLTLSHYGLNSLKAVSVDLNTGAISQQVVEKCKSSEFEKCVNLEITRNFDVSYILARFHYWNFSRTNSNVFTSITRG